jgi:diacylglycerol diphosphate phosphatase/phosphatidate phosphatase
VGAAARFYQRSYAADYIALGFLAMGWLLVSQYFVSLMLEIVANAYFLS